MSGTQRAHGLTVPPFGAPSRGTERCGGQADGRAPATAPPGPSRRRSLPGYLVMPRPRDAVKGLLMPFTFLLAVAAGADVTGRTVARALIVWGALELLVYPARYQWNDVRGFVADQRHPAEQDRGRLPGPVECVRSRVTASCAVAVARLAAVASLALALPGLHLTGVLCAVTAAVFGVAVVYEALRAAGTGRSGAIPPPARPAVVALWITVGAGYVVRGMAGVALAVDLRGRPGLAVSAAVALWAFGVAFVTSRWVVESLAFASSNHGRLTWAVRADQAREHLLALVRWLPRPPRGTAPADWAPLRQRTSPIAPWNLALLVSGTAAAATGSLLVTPASAGHALVAAALGAVTATAVILLPAPRPAVAAAGAALLLVVPALTGQPRAWAALLPWAAVMAAHLVFSSHSLTTMGRLPGRLRSLTAAPCAAVARTVVGQATWDALRKDAGGPR